MKVFDKQFFITLIVFFSPLCNEVLAATTQSWFFAMASDGIIENSADNDSIENTQQYFSKKGITFKDNILYVEGLFSCEIVDEKETPVNYWHSAKTASFYRDFLKKYSIRLDNEIDVITTTDPNSQCQLPFSEFIKTDNALMLTYKNRAIWYFTDDDARLNQIKNQKKVKMLSESVNKIICKETSNEMDLVYTEGYIVTCIYPKTDVLSAYLSFREEHKAEEVFSQLKKSLTLGKNEKIKILPDFFIQYNWKSNNNELEIDILQQGGETKLNFKKASEDTIVKKISFPD
jgi:hypothetical protein